MKTFKQYCCTYTTQAMTCESTIPEVIGELLAVQETYDRVTVTLDWDHADTWVLRFTRAEE